MGGLDQKINLLAVANWPLGGIRTYMKYTYKYLSRDRFNITILAQKTAEEDAFKKDAEELRAKVIVVPSQRRLDLWLRLFKILAKEKVQIIQSHGLISAAYVYLVNFFFRVPHVLTLHGIIEERLMGKGLASFFKRTFLSFLINSVTVLYGVSHDIIEHFEHALRIKDSVKKVVIHNGIDLEKFKTASGETRSSFRSRYHLSESIFLIGFVGRFMPQKGFDYLIEAIEILTRENKGNGIQVLAVGSGDYLETYKKTINEKELNEKFLFIPFQRDIIPVYQAVDLIAMPSVWEAYGLQAAEAIVLGVPIIVSNCIGLREAVKGTPAIMVPPQNSTILAQAIEEARAAPQKKLFQEFRKIALTKYDVRQTSVRLAELFESLVG